LIIRNYLNPLATKTTQVNDKTVITIENLFSIFVLYAGAIGLAAFIQTVEVIIRKKVLKKIVTFIRDIRNTSHKRQ
jgi:hypothetical protein